MAEQTNDAWSAFLGRSQQPDSLFGVPKRRGGTAQHGGVLWQDFRDLLGAARPFRQMVGHTLLGGPESDPHGRMFGLDTGGARLEVALVLPDRRMFFGSSLVP